jgi:arylsulfatase A-like enzyme
MHGFKIVLLHLLLAVSIHAADRPPNIILIMADDMGYGGLSCYDNPYFETPEIDRLAADGLRLTDFHSNGSVCTPTRAALMTGRYQHRSGCYVVTNADPEHEDHRRGLQTNEWTFAEAMKEAGYTTAIYGKWHLGYDPKFNPVNNGFDEYRGFVSGNIDAQSHYDRMETFDWWQNKELKDDRGYHTDVLTEHTLSFIDRNKDRPFFIYLAHGAPHSPHQARGSKILRGPDKGNVPEWGLDEPEYTDTPGDKDWLIKHFILPVDEGVGRIRQRIEELGLADNTMIWFISDNGGTAKNWTVSPKTRGSKAKMYEGGHRVPGIVWAPGRIQPGTSSELIIGMDIMPTCMALANVKAPAGHHLDGIDVGPTLFTGKPLATRAVFWGKGGEKRALREGPWKLVRNELYNLTDDPRETTDLAEKYPEKMQEMSKIFQAMYDNALSDSPYD